MLDSTSDMAVGAVVALSPIEWGEAALRGTEDQHIAKMVDFSYPNVSIGDASNAYIKYRPAMTRIAKASAEVLKKEIPSTGASLIDSAVAAIETGEEVNGISMQDILIHEIPSFATAGARLAGKAYHAFLPVAANLRPPRRLGPTPRF